MKLNITDLIEILEDAADQGLTDVEIHFQPQYPLKGRLANARILDGKMTLAVDYGSEYGSKRAWDDPEEDEECCDACDGPLTSDGEYADGVCYACQDEMEEAV